MDRIATSDKGRGNKHMALRRRTFLQREYLQREIIDGRVSLSNLLLEALDLAFEAKSAGRRGNVDGGYKGKKSGAFKRLENAKGVMSPQTQCCLKFTKGTAAGENSSQRTISSIGRAIDTVVLFRR